MLHHIELPIICNQSCIFCIIGAKEVKAPGKINIEKIRKELEPLERNYTISIGGGEPFYWENIGDLVLLLKELKFERFYIISNGSIPSKLENLHNLGLKEIVFSFFSFNENIHNKLTKSQNFNNLLESIKVSVSLKMNVSINCILTKFNENSLFKDSEKLFSMGINFISFQPIVFEGFGKNINQSLLKSDFSKLSQIFNNLIIPKYKEKIDFNFFPYCLLSEDFLKRKNLENIDFKKNIFQEKNFIKKEKCLKCKYLKSCFGVLRGYEEFI